MEALVQGVVHGRIARCRRSCSPSRRAPPPATAGWRLSSLQRQKSAPRTVRGVRRVIVGSAQRDHPPATRGNQLILCLEHATEGPNELRRRCPGRVVGRGNLKGRVLTFRCPSPNRRHKNLQAMPRPKEVRRGRVRATGGSCPVAGRMDRLGGNIGRPVGGAPSHVPCFAWFRSSEERGDPRAARCVAPLVLAERAGVFRLSWSFPAVSARARAPRSRHRAHCCVRCLHRPSPGCRGVSLPFSLLALWVQTFPRWSWRSPGGFLLPRV